MNALYDRAAEAAAYIRAQTATAASVPTVAVVLGSGLQLLAEELEGVVHLSYETIPHFPRATVASHAGVLSVGKLSGRPVFLLSGRVHGYEGYDMTTLTFYVRVLHLLGVKTLVLTNAAGGINEAFSEGDFMLITDHIKFSDDSPVRGTQDDRFTARFFDMSRAYAPRLQEIVRRCARENDLLLREGVYAYMSGPQYETPAEIRMLRLLGADAVGMSTVPEAIMAVGCGMEVLGISCITNMAAGINADATLSDQEVRDTALRVSQDFCQLVRATIMAI